MACNNLMEQLDQVRENPRNKHRLGDFGEAVAEVLLHDILGHEIVADLATRNGPQGVDLITADTRGKINVTEVKATAAKNYTGPRMNKKTGQMGDLWTADRSRKAGLDAIGIDDVTEGEIGKLVVHVDVERDTVAVHHVDSVGKVDRTAEMVFGLEDLVRFVDAIRADEAT